MPTLFFHFQFWFFHGNTLSLGHSLAVNTISLALFATTLALLFVAGPARAIQRSTGLFPAIETSLGRLPAHAIRLCSIYVLVDTLSRTLAISAGWQLPFILRRDVARHETAITATLLLLYLAYTARHQSMDRFTLRLSLAVLIAAALRVHEGWPEIFSTRPASTDFHTLEELALTIAPLGLLAAAHTPKIRHFAFPLFASLFLVGLINLATHNSGFAGPKGLVNIANALWGGAAGSAVPGSMMIAIITTFGAARFSLRELANAACTKTIFALTLTAIAALTAWRTRETIVAFYELHSDLPATVLAITAAILTADALHNRPTPPKQINWIATLALLTALAVAYAVANTNAIPNQSWLLPSYITAFAITIAGRKLQRS